MESRNYICGGNKFAHSKGYIGLPVEAGNLPDTVLIVGETLHKKSSFHISLLCVKDILASRDILEQDVVDTFCSFVKQKDISFVRYTGEFRFVRHEERRTLVALCEVSNLLELSRALGDTLGITLAPQPTHVTLYTLQPDAGIGLNSPADMETKSIPVDVPATLKEALGIGQE
jgi:hypothetical protein